ncbi:MAG: hypothetical protein AAGG11_01020 [Pseudomonadota bacterium]
MQNQQEKSPRASSDRLSDIAFFESIARQETRSVANRLRGTINPSEDPTAQIESLIEEVSDSIGRLGARMQIMETVLANWTAQSEVLRSAPAPAALLDSLHQTAEHWDDSPNLQALEFDDQSRPFRWSGAQRTVRFKLPVDRSRDRGIRIIVVALIKQEYLRALQLLVDGAPIEYQLQYVDGTNQLLGKVPQADTTTTTCLDIVLPATHSPHELGVSKDKRKLGIALSAIILTAETPAPRHGFGARLRQLGRRLGL